MALRSYIFKRGLVVFKGTVCLIILFEYILPVCFSLSTVSLYAAYIIQRHIF